MQKDFRKFFEENTPFLPRYSPRSSQMPGNTFKRDGGFSNQTLGWLFLLFLGWVPEGEI
jgi:hypothetical protein